MVIGIDASRANNNEKTGVEWYAYFVIQELKKIIPADVQVRLYTREPLKGDLARLPPNWQEKVLSWPPRRLWTQLRLSYEVWRQPPDVLFVPAHVLPLVVPKKTFLTIHDLGGLRFPAGYTLFEKVYARFYIRFALARAQIITPSEFTREEILYLFKTPLEKIKVIYNSYDNNLFKPVTDQEKIQTVLRKYNIHRPFFLSISRLEEKKNTAGIIEAFEIFKEQRTKNKEQETKLVLLGKPGHGFAKVEKAIESSKYKNDIILPGWVETADVPVLMSAAIAFIFPSFYEGFGIPILEAQACGLPVITSNLASCPEVAHTAAILVNPYRPAEIAQAMNEIVSSEKLASQLKEAGLNRVKEFGWNKAAEAIWQALLSA
ncbi:MAG: glycosyltransferase family 1 protein [Patescibacteria group bacterium]|mgnify:FL=1